MENQDYLDHISASIRPEKNTSSGIGKIFSSIYTKIILGGLALFFLLMIGSSLFKGTKTSLKDKTISLYMRINNVTQEVQTYQKDLKSSDLRSNTASFQSVLSNTARDLNEYISANYKYKEKELIGQIYSDDATEYEELQQTLFNAKINGILDRVFAHKIAYEIEVIAQRETEIINSTENAYLQEVLTTSYNSIANLYDKFNDFSEAK